MTILWEFDEKHPKRVSAYGTSSRVPALTRAWKAQDWTSWVILSRPCGTGLAGHVHPALTCWAIFSRPCGLKSEAAGSRADNKARFFVRPQRTRLKSGPDIKHQSTDHQRTRAFLRLGFIGAGLGPSETADPPACRGICGSLTGLLHLEQRCAAGVKDDGVVG